MLQRLAFQQLHHEEPLAVVLADVEERADVRMVERRCDARLALEAFDRLRIARQLGRQDFDGGLPAQPGVLGAINDTHAAAPELFDDAVVRKGLADHCRNLYILERRQPCLRPVLWMWTICQPSARRAKTTVKRFCAKRPMTSVPWSSHVATAMLPNRRVRTSSCCDGGAGRRALARIPVTSSSAVRMPSSATRRTSLPTYCR